MSAFIVINEPFYCICSLQRFGLSAPHPLTNHGLCVCLGLSKALSHAAGGKRLFEGLCWIFGCHRPVPRCALAESSPWC